VRDVSDRFVVVLDANVLYPFRLRDVLLRFAEAGLFRARWTDRIIAEWRDSLLKAKPDLEANIDAQLEAMRRAFPEAWVDGYEELIEAITLPDPDDRHVVAAAIRANAEHIVTENLRDFPPDAIGQYGIEAVAADDFLTSTFELYPSEAVAALHTMRVAYRNPAMSTDEFLFDLQRATLPKLASLAKEHIDVL